MLNYYDFLILSFEKNHDFFIMENYQYFINSDGNKTQLFKILSSDRYISFKTVKYFFKILNMQSYCFHHCRRMNNEYFHKCGFPYHRLYENGKIFYSSL